MEKIKILVIPSDKSGVGKYRSIDPHVLISETHKDIFDIDIEYNPDWNDLEKLSQYNIINFHKGLYTNMTSFYKAIEFCKAKGCKIIMDIDDFWNLHPNHPLYHQYTLTNTDKLIIRNLKLADYITTTTEIFAKKIRKFNNNVVVIPNAVNPEEKQYTKIKNPSKRLRFGFVMGSSHEKDMEQFKGVVNALKNMNILDKIQFVLCGFDTSGVFNIIGPDGQIKSSQPIDPKDSVWTKYEKIITDNYNIITPEYRKFLSEYNQNKIWENIDNEPYRREWTKNINEFATHYQNVDVLLVPLDTNEFNEVKSELKFVEAGFTNTAVIASNFGPYTIGSINMLEKGGNINKNGNCILIDPIKKDKGWTKAIKKLVDNPELVDILKDNMNKTVSEKYDLKNVNEKRVSLYKEILQEKVA